MFSKAVQSIRTSSSRRFVTVTSNSKRFATTGTDAAPSARNGGPSAASADGPASPSLEQMTEPAEKGNNYYTYVIGAAMAAVGIAYVGTGVGAKEKKEELKQEPTQNKPQPNTEGGKVTLEK